MNKAISRIFIVGVVLFVALVVNLTWIMAVRAGWYQDRPENRRSIAQEMKTRRGNILGFDGSKIAGSVRRSGYYYRTYPQGTVAPQLIGYNSSLYGRTGIEETMNDVLTGTASDLGVQTWVDRLLGRKPKGADVKLTLVPAVQKVAQRKLYGQVGADRFGLGAELQPDDARRLLGAAQRRPFGTTAQPGDAGAVPARIVVQGRYRHLGAGVRQGHADN
jgi:cell division protein FtsI/penicillin-binding protein 2